MKHEDVREPREPFALLLERYVMWAIGVLTDDELAGMDKLSPRLAEIYGGDGTWQGAVASAMEFPTNMVALIREKWEHNQRIAATAGEVLTPPDFARMFVQANFSRDEDIVS